MGVGKELLTPSPTIYSVGGELAGDLLNVLDPRRHVAAELEVIENEITHFFIWSSHRHHSRE